MVRRALVERRPWLLASLLVALAWWFLGDSDAVPGLFKVIWKGMPLLLLSAYAWQRHLGPDGYVLSGALLVASVADMMSELIYATAGTIMAFSLLLMIWLYVRNRREHASISQKLLAFVLVLTIPVLTWALLVGEEGRLLATGFGLLLGIMAAMAWTSRFSRYRVGAGAMLVLLSELVLFATLGPALRGNAVAEFLVWPLYYAGQLMVATGIVVRLRREAES